MRQAVQSFVHGGNSARGARQLTAVIDPLDQPGVQCRKHQAVALRGTLLGGSQQGRQFLQFRLQGDTLGFEQLCECRRQLPGEQVAWIGARGIEVVECHGQAAGRGVVAQVAQQFRALDGRT